MSTEPSNKPCIEDAFEENDTLEGAVPLLLNQQYQLSFCSDSVDVVSFQLESGQFYQLENTEGDTTYGVEYDLYQPGGTKMFNQNSSKGELFQAAQSGTHKAVFYPNHEADEETTIRLLQQ